MNRLTESKTHCLFSQCENAGRFMTMHLPQIIYRTLLSNHITAHFSEMCNNTAPRRLWDASSDRLVFQVSYRAIKYNNDKNKHVV